MWAFGTWIIFKMFKHSKPFLLVLACLLLIGQAQDLIVGSSNPMNMFEGAQLPHIFSQYMVLDPASGNIDFSQAFTLTIPQGIFTTTENVYIVAGNPFLMQAFPTLNSVTFLKIKESSSSIEPTPRSMQLEPNSPLPFATSRQHLQLQLGSHSDTTSCSLVPTSKAPQKPLKVLSSTGNSMTSGVSILLFKMHGSTSIQMMKDPPSTISWMEFQVKGVG